MLSGKLTLVEGLDTDADNVQTMMRWYTQFNFLIVRCRHPKRQTSIVNEVQSSEIEDVIKHSLKAVRLLRRNVFVLPKSVSKWLWDNRGSISQIGRLAVDIDSFLSTTVLRSKDFQPFSDSVRWITDNAIEDSTNLERTMC